MRQPLIARLASPELWLLLAAALAGPAAAAGPFDGIYAGTTTVVGNSRPDCFWKARRIRVLDNQINQEFDGAPMSVAISPDGSFSTSGQRQIRKGQQPVTFNGVIQDGMLDATVQKPQCTFRLSFHKRLGKAGARPAL